MRLRVLSDYQSGGRRYRAGEVIEVGELLGRHLLRDSPGSFEVVPEESAPAEKEQVTRPVPRGRRRG